MLETPRVSAPMTPRSDGAGGGGRPGSPGTASGRFLVRPLTAVCSVWTRKASSRVPDPPAGNSANQQVSVSRRLWVMSSECRLASGHRSIVAGRCEVVTAASRGWRPGAPRCWLTVCGLLLSPAPPSPPLFMRSWRS